jgi:hypothetical protein
MANDGGLIASLEQWFADTLAALAIDTVLVFPPGLNGIKRADVWKHQVGPLAGGIEALDKYAPCAFVSYFNDQAAREGDYDLREVLEFTILIGQECREAGVARFGSATEFGVSKLRDLVIAAFDRKHPGGSFTCDEIYYTGSSEVYDSPKQYAIEMHFEVSKMTPVN